MSLAPAVAAPAATGRVRSERPLDPIARTGSGMVLLGVVLVGVAIALGG